MLEIRALLTAEGALVLAALQRAADRMFRQSAHRASDDRTHQADDPYADRTGQDGGDLPARAGQTADARTDPADNDVPAEAIGHLVQPNGVLDSNMQVRGHRLDPLSS